MTRSCGDCQLCCKLMPVKEIGKPGYTRCKHQVAGKGCAIYARRPMSCKVFSCVWLSDPQATRDLSRPDRSRYVIDPMPDFVTLSDDRDGSTSRIPVIQIWCDPKQPDAHRDPALRAYLARWAERGVAALVRRGRREALALFAPAMSADGQWHEVESPQEMGPEHNLAEIAAALGAEIVVMR